MELSSNILNTLKSIGDKKISNETYNLIVKNLFDSFIFNKDNNLDICLNTVKLESDKSGGNVTKGELKDALSSLYTLISELAKHDYSGDSVSTFLEDVGFTNEKIKVFVDCYLERKALIRMFLTNVTFSHPHVVDVSWRLDYCVKENNMERINEPIYLVELKVEKPNEDKLSKIQFSCSVDQLQDLVYKLKEACKSLEKLAGATSKD